MSIPQNYLNYMSGLDVYQELKDSILTLKLKPGQVISENEIAGLYNVSRTPIKSAFLRLKCEKYIEIVPQKGSYVTLLDMKYIKDIIYMRTVLELDMLKTIIDENLVGQVVEKLEDNLEQQMHLINSENVNPNSFYEVDSAFHRCFFEEAGRENMWEVIQDCQVYYSRFRMLDTMVTARYKELHAEHKRIVAALKNKDKQELKACVFDHLHGNIRVLSEKIEGEYRGYFVQHD